MCLDAHRNTWILICNISISVSDYCILAAQVPVMFVFCNTNRYNFRMTTVALYYIIICYYYIICTIRGILKFQ